MSIESCFKNCINNGGQYKFGEHASEMGHNQNNRNTQFCNIYIMKDRLSAEWSECLSAHQEYASTILTLSDLNLFKGKKKKLKNITKQVKSKSIYRSCHYRKQLNSSAKIQTMI